MDMSLLDALPIGVMVLDADHHILGWNHWLEEHTRIGSADALGRTLTELYPNVINRRFEMAVDHALRKGGPQILSQALHGHLIPIELPHLANHGLGLMRQHVHIEGLWDAQSGNPVAAVSIIDVTGGVLRTEALTDIAQRLEDDVNHDHLTRLFNRRFVWEWLEHQHKQAIRYDYPIAALMLDLDHFKKINDEFGHLVGDQVLRQFACMLTEWVRESDIVARFGGEEFLILLPRCGHDLAIEVAERIVLQTRESALDSLPAGRITCSIGVSLVDPADPISATELLREADRRLYQAKSKGRNQVVFQDQAA